MPPSRSVVFRLFGLLLLAAVASVGVAARAHDDGGVLEEILDRGVLRVGLSSFSPWAMRSTDGDFIGFEVDVARAVAEDMDVKLEIVPTAWDGIIPALLAKKFDIIISGMYVTPARNLQANFTNSYDENGLDMVANRELAAGMTTLADFNDGEVVIAARRGSYPVAYARENLPKAEIRQFDDDASALQEALNGRAHAWITAEPQPLFAAMDYPDKLFRPIPERLTINRQGMALRKGDADALNYFNHWIAARKQSGWLEERHQYWFGGREWSGRVGAE